MEAVREYGPNVMSFEVATGARRWYIIGCYLAPDDTSTIERVVAALRDRPKGTALVVEGELNTDLEDSENDWRGTEIAAAMIASGVEDTTAHFLPRRRRWVRERTMWSMVREGKVVRSRMDYLLGQTEVSLLMCPSVTHDITPTILWWWAAYAAPQRGSIPNTLQEGGNRRYGHLPSQQGRTGSLRPYGGPCQNPTRGTGRKMSGSRRRRGG